MTAMARGCCICEPAPMPSESGSKASTAARVVIKIGRVRAEPARTNASSKPKPSASNSFT